MAAPKIPPSIVEELADMNLVIWFCGYGSKHVDGSTRLRQDTSIVNVQITGPGLTERSPWGRGPTLRAAIDNAIRDPLIVDRVTGLKGAIMRFDKALADLGHAVLLRRLAMHSNFDDSDEDTIPF
jgi:hypothetical protein